MCIKFNEFFSAMFQQGRLNLYLWTRNQQNNRQTALARSIWDTHSQCTQNHLSFSRYLKIHPGVATRRKLYDVVSVCPAGNSWISWHRAACRMFVAVYSFTKMKPNSVGWRCLKFREKLASSSMHLAIMHPVKEST